MTPARAGTPIAPTVIGLGGRVPPSRVIDNDSVGDVETSPSFDPQQDGIDFHESLEGMLVQVNNPLAVGPDERLRRDPGRRPTRAARRPAHARAAA